MKNVLSEEMAVGGRWFLEICRGINGVCKKEKGKKGKKKEKL